MLTIYLCNQKQQSVLLHLVTRITNENQTLSTAQSRACAPYTRQTNGLRSISLECAGAGHSTHLVWGGSLPSPGQVLLDILEHVYQLTKCKELLQPLCKSSHARTASRLAGSSVSAGHCQEEDRCIGVALASDGSVQIVQIQAEGNLRFLLSSLVSIAGTTSNNK